MPRKQPISVILGKGNKAHLSKAEILEREQTEIKAPDDDIRIPGCLKSKKLKDRFNFIVEELKELNLMSNLDVDAVARYIIAEYQLKSITELLNKTSIMIEIIDEIGNKDYVVNKEYERLSVMKEKLFKQARSAASDIGLTITSRCKLVVPKVKKEETNHDDFSKLFDI